MNAPLLTGRYPGLVLMSMCVFRLIVTPCIGDFFLFLYPWMAESIRPLVELVFYTQPNQQHSLSHHENCAVGYL
jgi:hypothetical protein